jgi:MFS family permease
MKRHAPLALLAFAMLIVSLDQYIVVVALPEIGRDLGYSAQTLQSVISAYTVTSSGFLLLGGRAADLLGRRKVLVSGLKLFMRAAALDRVKLHMTLSTGHLPGSGGEGMG